MGEFRLRLHNRRSNLELQTAATSALRGDTRVLQNKDIALLSCIKRLLLASLTFDRPTYSRSNRMFGFIYACLPLFPSLIWVQLSSACCISLSHFLYPLPLDPISLSLKLFTPLAPPLVSTFLIYVLSTFVMLGNQLKICMRMTDYLTTPHALQPQDSTCLRQSGFVGMTIVHPSCI